jgi:hypothetical protein
MDSDPSAQENERFRRRARTDLLVLVVGAVVAFFVLARLEAFEAFAGWARRQESLQLDEVLTLAVLLAVGFGIFAQRRWRDLERERVLRTKAETSARRLEGFLPICSGCKRIRESDGGWTPVEDYLSARIEADFTHGLCPECSKRLYPELTR